MGVAQLNQFEFVQVTVAIILGLGLTDILRNLGEQFRARREIEVSWLQIGASCLLLFVILIYLWSFWLGSGITWTFPLFMLQVASAIALALSPQFIKVDVSSAETLEDQYFANARATYIVWATGPVFALVFALAADIAGTVDVGRIVAAALLISLGLVKHRGYHRVVLTTLLLLAIVFVTVIGPGIGLFELR